jgi:peptidoglycan/LPS O-acetylase OafA/YrhL
MSKSRVDSLDILRGIASLSVAFMHCYYLLGLKSAFPQGEFLIRHLGTLVYLFFIISGVSLILSIKEEKFLVSSFMISRIFRIAPLFYFAGLATYLSLKIIGADVSHYSFSRLLWNFSLLFNLSASSTTAESLVGAGWTIGVEVIFYILFSLLIGMSSGNLWIALAISLVVSFLMRLNLIGIVNPDDLSSWIILYAFPIYLPMFIAGMILGRFAAKQKMKSEFGNTALVTSVLLICLIVGLNLQQSWVIYLWTIVFVLQVIWGLNATLRKNRLNHVLIFLGKISYSTYILHSLILFLFSRLINSISLNTAELQVFQFLLLIGAYVAILIVVSWLTYKYVEKPFIGYGKKLAKRL